MPYAPGITDRSGEILAAGIAQAAQEYADSNEKMQLTQKEIDHLAGTVQFAAQKGILKPEELQQFAQGNLSKKREIASRAGMLYQDMQAAADRATISPEMAAELKAAGYLAAPAGGGRMQFLQMPEQPWQPSAADLKTATEAGLVPVQVAKGRFQFVEKPNASGLQVTPIPGTDYVAPTINGRSLGTLPVSGSKSFQPTPEMIQAAMDGGYQYLQTDKGPVLRAMRGGTTSRPTAAQPLVDEIYRANGMPTADELKRRQAEILAAIGAKRETYATTNPLGETRGEEMRRLAAELARTEQRQPAGVRTPAPKTAHQVKASAGDRAKFAGPTMPASDGLPTADPLQRAGDTGGDVLPPLPDAPVKIESVEQYLKLPSGAKFYDAQGNVRQKK